MSGVSRIDILTAECGKNFLTRGGVGKKIFSLGGEYIASKKASKYLLFLLGAPGEVILER